MDLQVGDRVEKISDEVDCFVPIGMLGRVIEIRRQNDRADYRWAMVQWDEREDLLGYRIMDEGASIDERLYSLLAENAFRKIDYKNDWEDSLELI